MKSKQGCLSAITATAGLWAAPCQALEVDQAVDAAFKPVARAMSEVVFFAVPVGDAQLPLIVLWLVVGGIVTQAFTPEGATGGFFAVLILGFRPPLSPTRRASAPPPLPMRP